MLAHLEQRKRQLETLKKAYYSGLLRCRFADGYEVTYQTSAELRRAIAELEREIAGSSTEKKFKAVKVVVSSGL